MNQKMVCYWSVLLVGDWYPESAIEKKKWYENQVLIFWLMFLLHKYDCVNIDVKTNCNSGYFTEILNTW